MTNTIYGVQVQPTRIGQGVFAEGIIYEGQVIGEIRGRIIDEFDDFDPDYCIDLDGVRMLEPTAPFRYLNHSCEPNCEIFGWDDSDDQLWLEALRPIAAGEQLTIDYAWGADHAIRCRCETTACRGWVVAVEELPRIALAAAVENFETAERLDESSSVTLGNLKPHFTHQHLHVIPTSLLGRGIAE